MSISINRNTSVIFVPRADLVAADSPDDTLYNHDTNAFRLELKAIEASEEGIVFQDAHQHVAEYTVSGVTYARGILIINGHSVEYEDGQYSVTLNGSNNDIWDVQGGKLVRNQVQVIPTNSAGLIVNTVISGSGLSAGQDASLTNIEDLLSTIEGTFDHREAMRLMLAILTGRVTGAGSGTETFRDTTDTTDRVVVTVDSSGNRSTVVRDPS